MATAHQIRDLITETTTGSVRPRVPREVRDEVCRYAARRRAKGAPWAVIAGGHAASCPEPGHGHPGARPQAPGILRERRQLTFRPRKRENGRGVSVN